MNIFLFETTTFNNQVSAEEKHELKLQNKKSYIDGTSRKKKKKKNHNTKLSATTNTNKKNNHQKSKSTLKSNQDPTLPRE